MLSEAKHPRLLRWELEKIPEILRFAQDDNCALEFGIWSFRLQADGMPCLKPMRRSINRIPARRPFACVTIEWRRVEPQPGNDCKRVTIARVYGDPFAGAALAVAAELG